MDKYWKSGVFYESSIDPDAGWYRIIKGEVVLFYFKKSREFKVCKDSQLHVVAGFKVKQ